jgi:predicted transcriptional regulator
MAKYRDRLQIIAEILSIVSRGAKKTQIMYQANLSYKLLCRYLGEVLNAGLVGFDDEDCYVLTSKGKEFLDRYGEYSRHRERLRDQLNSVNNEKIVLEQMCSTEEALENGSDCSAKRRPIKKSA